LKLISKEIVDLIIQDAALNISQDLNSGKETLDSLFLDINNSPKLDENSKLFLKNFIASLLGFQ
jgi:hypothetical protein